MSLSDDEQGRLKEIEAHERAVDPRFAARLDLPAAIERDRRLRIMCRWLLTLGGWMAFMGVVVAQGPISIGTVLACSGCALMVWALLTGWSRRPPA